PIEDRDLERNVEPALAEWLRIGVLSALVDASDVEQCDEPRCLRELERFGERQQLQARDLQVDAVADGIGLDEGKRPRTARQRWQPTGKAKTETAPPEPHQPHKPLARRSSLLPRRRQIRGRFGIEYLLAGLVELVHRPCLAKLGRKLGRGLGSR